MERPLRILHTADWHLGKTLKGRDRTPEVAEALEAVANLAKEERVDLVLAAGDLLDHPQPSAEAEGVLVEFLLRLRKEGIPCFLVAGNHDPPERFERLYRRLLEPEVQVRGRLALADEGGLVEFQGLRFALVPFVSERLLVKTLAMPSEERRLAYGERMGRLLSHYQADILVGHLTVAGSRPGGGEYALYLADHYAVPPGLLPPARYIALGHLHRMQGVAENAHYPGSLIALDFGAEEVERGVLLVEVPPERHLPVRVHPVVERWGRPLRTFRFPAQEAQAHQEEVRQFRVWAKVILEGPAEPGLRDAFLAMDHVLEVSVTGNRDSKTGPEEVPDTLEEAYALYLEEKGQKREERIWAFQELRQEVRHASPED